MERKYGKGGQIKTLEEFSEWIAEGKWIFWHDRPKHPSILANQQYRVIIELIETGALHRAIEKEKTNERSAGSEEADRVDL